LCGPRWVKAGIGVFARISAVLGYVDEIYMGNPGLHESRSIVALTRLRELVVAFVWLLLGSVHHGISRRGRPRRSPLLSAFAVRTRDTEIVLGMLVQIFRGDGIAANRDFARERDVALENLVGAAADLHARAIAVEDLVTLRCPLLLRLDWPITVIASARWALA
jgi:hypothetical protein